MMTNRLTAKDIESQEFSRKLRGCATEEVQLYLKSVADEVERLNLENGDLRDELGNLRRQLEDVRGREQTLQETLVSAQRMTDEMKHKAHGEAELVVKEARVRADEIVQQAQTTLVQIEMDISRSKLERETLEHRLRAVLEQHQTMLEMRRQGRLDKDNLHVMPNRVGSEVG
jgi:cell division initiation protein